jgi:rubrerythrin
MAMEREGIAYYEKAARKVSNAKVRKVLTYLARQEKDHARSLQEKSQFLQPAVQRRAAAKPEVQRFIHDHILGKVFPDGAGKDSEDLIRTDSDAVDIGIQSEKKSIEVLERLMAQVTKIDVRTVFSHLMAEEKKHLTELEALKAKLP